MMEKKEELQLAALLQLLVPPLPDLLERGPFLGQLPHAVLHSALAALGGNGGRHFLAQRLQLVKPRMGEYMNDDLSP